MFTRAPLVKQTAAPKVAAPAKQAPDYFSKEELTEAASPEYAYSLAGARAFSSGEDDGGANRFRGLRRLPIQAKLAVGAVDDPLEKEADETANRVLGMSVGRSAGFSKAGPSVQRKCSCGGSCEKCKAEEDEQGSKLQRKAAGADNLRQRVAPPIVHEVLHSAGHPLNAHTRSFMEPRFGYDFGQVRIHNDTRAIESANAIGAKAYTVGHHIVFGDGQGSLANSSGRRLIAHELTHVVQQQSEPMAVRRDPDPDTSKSADRWKKDLGFAKYRGHVMAMRVRQHGKLSKEAREKINRELAYFDGTAKDAYLKEVRQVLHQVVEIEMPEVNMARPINPPAPLSLFALDEDPTLCAGHPCPSDHDLGIPDPPDREAEEFALRKELNLDSLNGQIKDWLPQDQAFAVELLTQLIEHRVRPDRMPEAIRKPVLDRYLEWMKRVDAKRLEQCDPDRGAIATARATASNDDPCKSWFGPQSTHAQSELEHLERVLKLTVKATRETTPSDEVYWSVFEYRKLTDPKMLDQAEMAGMMVGAFVAIVDGVNVSMKSVPTRIAMEPEPPPNVSTGAKVPEPPVTPPAAPKTAPSAPTPPEPPPKVAASPDQATVRVDVDDATAAKGANKTKAPGAKTTSTQASDDASAAKGSGKSKTTKAVTQREDDEAKEQQKTTLSAKSKDKDSNTTDNGGQRRKVDIDKPAPKPDPVVAPRSGPISPTEVRIKAIAGKDITVGMRAQVKLKTGNSAVKGLRGASFADLDKGRAEAVGGSKRAAVLPDVSMPKWAGAKRGSQPSAGLVVEPPKGSESIEVVAWNTGDPIKEANISHAERQFIEWFRSQSGKWTSQVESVEVEVYGRDICTNCEADLKSLEDAFPEVKFDWKRTDTGQVYKPPRPPAPPNAPKR